MAPPHVLAFLAVASLVVITPGVDMALVTRNALLHGRGAALATAAGINAGVAVWTVAATAGLAAIVAASAPIFAAIRVAGAVYLLYLGINALRRARRRERLDRSPRELRGRSAFRQGLTSNLLNPKIAVFFTSLLPPFAGSSADIGQLLVLGALFNLLGLLWLTTYAMLVSRARAVLVGSRVEAALERVSGIVLVGLGLRLAIDRHA
jgi:threonine/homoserine/homoserine lactone efflux protein